MSPHINRSDLIRRIARHNPELSDRDVALVVSTILEKIAAALCQGRRAEIRGFGSFELVLHLPRVGRNPKTGERLEFPARFSLRFKAGRELRQRINKKAAPT